MLGKNPNSVGAPYSPPLPRSPSSLPFFLPRRCSQTTYPSTMSQAQTTSVTRTAAADKSSGIRSVNASMPTKGCYEQNLVGIDPFGEKFYVPDYSIRDILSLIPKHCYNRSVVRSMGYALRDVAALIVTGYAAHTLIPLLDSPVVRFVAWLAYAFTQSLFCTGLWVLAHECGHSAFSDYGWLNDTVGFILHSYLLVPYFSWKFSHSKHHKATGHMARDMVFVPKTRDQFIASRKATSLDEIMEDSPIKSVLGLVAQQLFGWILYLFSNVTGQNYVGVSWLQANHFNPKSVIFDPRDYWYVLLADVGLAIQAFVLYSWYQHNSFSLLVDWFIPYILVNHWLVFITFLQHLDARLAHLDDSQWTFARGAATTIDRNFGFIGQHLFHDIIETHVLHHYVSRIPFYNAREATEAIKKVMGIHYKHSDDSMWWSLWETVRMCQFVEGENGVLMYRNVNGLGVPPKK